MTAEDIAPDQNINNEIIEDLIIVIHVRKASSRGYLYFTRLYVLSFRLSQTL